jgi:hypothetical protein
MVSLSGLNSNGWLPDLPPPFIHYTWVEVTDIDKHSNLMRYGKNYYRKSFITHAPGLMFESKDKSLSKWSTWKIWQGQTVQPICPERQLLRIKVS